MSRSILFEVANVFGQFQRQRDEVPGFLVYYIPLSVSFRCQPVSYTNHRHWQYLWGRLGWSGNECLLGHDPPTDHRRLETRSI